MFLAVILDLFSKYVVGWALSPLNDRFVTIRALDLAISPRCPSWSPSPLGPGNTYASEDYQKVLAAHGITCSRSRKGNVFDNAAMESWNSTFKSESGKRFDEHRGRRRRRSTTSRSSSISSVATRPSAM